MREISEREEPPDLRHGEHEEQEALTAASDDAEGGLLRCTPFDPELVELVGRSLVTVAAVAACRLQHRQFVSPDPTARSLWCVYRQARVG